MNKIFDFCDLSDFEKWKSIDDRVMGGSSNSEFTYYNECMAIFKGNVITKGGGFASVRYEDLQLDLSVYAGLKIKAKGDGKIYSLRLKNEEVSEGILYQMKFKTDINTWQTIKLPFDKFSPVFRGRIIFNAPHLDSSRIGGLGFMIADEQAGSFKIIISSISAYK